MKVVSSAMEELLAPNDLVLRLEKQKETACLTVAESGVRV